MKIDDIPADETVVMTSALIRLFKIEGCDPACHCCEHVIESGEEFTLAQIKTVEWYRGQEETDDEMLCESCTPEMLMESRKEDWKKRNEYLNRKGFTRKHRGEK